MLTLHSYTLRFKNSPLAPRLLAAGLIAGCAGVLVPQVMGIGYDTVELAMLGQASFTLLATIVVAKLLVSTTTLALGIPGGSIGPTLVIGACLGACLGFIGNLLTPSESAAIGFYAIVCMGAMMAGVLNAPLAALLALLELTYNPGILLPAMLVIVIACITTRMVSRLPGLFLIGRDTDAMSSPISQALSRIGVTSVMTRDFVSHPRHLQSEAAGTLLASHPEWILIEGSDIDANINTDNNQRAEVTTSQDDSSLPPKYILRAADLSRHLQSNTQQVSTDPSSSEQSDSLSTSEQSTTHHTSIDLMGIPGERWRLHPIHPRATLDEVMKLIRRKNGYAVYVSQTGPLSQTDVAGIITQEGIDRYYQ